MTHNQQVPEISRTYLVIAPKKSASGETNVTYYSDFSYWPSLSHMMNVQHLPYMVVEKMSHRKITFLAQIWYLLSRSACVELKMITGKNRSIALPASCMELFDWRQNKLKLKIYEHQRNTKKQSWQSSERDTCKLQQFMVGKICQKIFRVEEQKMMKMIGTGICEWDTCKCEGNWLGEGCLNESRRTRETCRKFAWENLI